MSPSTALWSPSGMGSCCQKQAICRQELKKNISAFLWRGHRAPDLTPVVMGTLPTLYPIASQSPCLQCLGWPTSPSAWGGNPKTRRGTQVTLKTSPTSLANSIPASIRNTKGSVYWRGRQIVRWESRDRAKSWCAFNRQSLELMLHIQLASRAGDTVSITTQRHRFIMKIESNTTNKDLPWRFRLCQRPSSEENETNSSSGPCHGSDVTWQEICLSSIFFWQRPLIETETSR